MKKIKTIITMLFIVTTLFAQSNELEENLTKHLNVLAGREMNGRRAGTKYAKKAADYIFNQFTEIGLNPEREVFKKDKYQNIVGTIPSKNGKYIIIGAHYDGVGPEFGRFQPAADDNASGTATLIELARMLVNEDLEYGIKFIAYDGEELGLYGSKYDSKKIEKNSDKYVLMISIDMVGHLRDEGRLIYSGAATFENGEELIRMSKVDNVGIRIQPVWPYAGLSTDTVGYDLKGIPTLNIDTGEETSSFHTKRDTIESLDIPGMALITQQICLFIKNVQGKINPTGVSNYKETEIRFGMGFGDSINLFALFPFASNEVGDFYFKVAPGVNARGLYNNDEVIKTLNLNFSAPIIISQKVKGMEMLYGLGPYYQAYLKDGKTLINQEIGIVFSEEFKCNAGIAGLDCFSLGCEIKEGLFNFYDSDKYDIKRTSSLSAYIGLYF